MNKGLASAVYLGWIALSGLLSAGPAQAAQATAPATLQGTAYDETKAVLLGVSVTARSLTTNISKSTLTDARGHYELTQLDGGDYEIQFELPGFRRQAVEVTLAQGETRTLDITLILAPFTETVTLVTSTRVEKPLVEVPAAVGVVEKEDIQLGRQQIGLDEALNKVPGLFLQNRYNFDQGTRISVRGFGARAGHGIRGVRILVDGISETLPDGQGQVDNIDFGSAERIEVMRGAASSLYGNASGGVINVITEDGPEEPFLETRLSTGAYGFQKYQLKAGGQQESLNYLLSLSGMTMDGYREHNRTENMQFNGKFRFQLDDTSDLTTLINFADAPVSLDPGAVTREQAESAPTSARLQNVQYNSGEAIRQARVGVVYRKQFNEKHELTANTYYVFRDLNKKLPFQAGGVTEFNRLVLGGGVKYVYQAQISGRRNRLTIGVDLDSQNDDRRRFNNNFGKTEDLVLNQVETVGGIGPYVQNELSLLEDLELTLGARYDRVRFEVEDLFLSDGEDSGERTLDQLSPMFGMLYKVSPTVNIYGNISTSFETPTTSEFYNPSGAGGFNPDLGPQRATNYEIGVKGSVGTDWRYEAAAFTIRLQDELIGYELPDFPGRTFYRNAGESTRNGLELGLSLRPVSDLNVSGTYTYSDFVFDSFVVDGEVFDGNMLPGIPPHQLYGEVSYSHPSGVYAVWDSLYIDDFFADNANTAVNESYTVSNLRLGYVVEVGDWELSPFIGLNNLFDARYIGNVRINSAGGRYYEPAPEFNAYGGLRLSYIF